MLQLLANVIAFLGPLLELFLSLYCNRCKFVVFLIVLVLLALF